MSKLTTHHVNSRKCFKTSIMRTMYESAEPSAWHEHDDECPRYRLVAIQWEDGRTTVGTISEVGSQQMFNQPDVWFIAGPNGPGVIRAGVNNKGNQVFYWDCSNPDHFIKHVALSVSFGGLTTREADDHYLWAAWQKRWQS